VNPKVRLDLILGSGRVECIQRGPDRLGAVLVHSRRRERGRLAFDPEPEVEHVEHIMVGTNGRGLDAERRCLWHREYERPTAMEGFDKAFGA
jgi:hypothetical protein